MASLSQKCQYGLRAVLQLSKGNNGRPVSVSQIAAAQAIPRRFLELIVQELKAGGIVEAHRGARGGYTLAMPPDKIPIGRVIRLMGGNVRPVDCIECGGDRPCSIADGCDFADFWRLVHNTVAGVYDTVTFRDLLSGSLPASADALLSLPRQQATPPSVDPPAMGPEPGSDSRVQQV